MFEIVGDDIAALNDSDLRTLIGLLCEAELRRQNYPTIAATWGGNQNAKDGGLDVRVALESGSKIRGPIPNANTGFQVKKPDMPRGEILKEMKPDGILRPVLLELADESGAYIIISSTGSTSDVALANRIAAMKEAVKDTLADDKLHFDFFDRNRIATWVRDHAGMIPWVRARAGKAVPGWQSFGPWSRAPDGVDPAYLTDSHARIRTARDDDDGDSLSTIDGINLIRESLQGSGKVVRLVGLSGVGKTRLAEALFDPTVGENALDPSLAIYTDVADRPDPPPQGLASDFNATETRAILVVDNCSPELHRQLSEVAREKGTSISILTIEYDIREDQPEGTDVFALEAASSEMIERLIGRRYPDLSLVDVSKISEFSGGNARIALALASRIETTETIAGLNNEELFKRLFHQRHDPDPTLLRIAEACSLVYSFEGEEVESDEAELSVLGRLAGRSADDVFSAVVELKRRDLVQARAEWRAVLPHAIANRLAKLALQDFPRAKVNTLLVEKASERLRRSFSRRLGYLDDSKEAKDIAKAWLMPGGLLGDPTALTELGRTMFTNIAPLVPNRVLSAMETAFTHADRTILEKNIAFTRLLRSLAYEEKYFERSVALLMRFATLADPYDEDVAGVVESLFQIALSGTHASIETRVRVARGLLSSSDIGVRAVGMKTLAALLKASNFSSHYDFDFGARSRDYGYYPGTDEEANEWFDMALALAEEFALKEGPLTHEARTILSTAFRDLWPSRQTALDGLFRNIALSGFWREGWASVRQTLTYDGEAMDSNTRGRLLSLEVCLRPRNLVDQVRGTVIGVHGAGHDLEDPHDGVEEDDDKDPNKAFAERHARAAATIDRLGHDVALDSDAFKTLLPELLSADGRVYELGRALAAATTSPRSVWDDIVIGFASTSAPRLSLLSGFLSATHARDPKLANIILDEVLQNPVLAPELPKLQASAALDEAGIMRLQRSLDLGTAPVDAYYGLAYGKVSDAVPGAALSDLIARIAAKEGGLPVALEILAMRLFADDNDKQTPAPEIVEVGRKLLQLFQFPVRGRQTSRTDFDLARIIRHSLKGDAGILIARDLCGNFIDASKRRAISGSDFDEVLGSLLTVQPLAVLDELFSGNEEALRKSVRIINDLTHHGKPALEVVPDETLFTWIAGNPVERFPIVAATIKLFARPSQTEPHEWTAVALRLLKEAPDQDQILAEFRKRLLPQSWSGSRATKLEGRLKLIEELPVDGQPGLLEKRRRLEADFSKIIDQEREYEKRDNLERNTRFE
jgi:hypothetical protein